MEKLRILKRRWINRIMLFISFLAAMYGLFWLFWILGTLFVNGFKHIDLKLFLEDSGPPGLNIGGLRQAFVGHLIITVLATLIGVPIGLFAGIYYAEYGRNSKFFWVLRNTTDIMVSTPSIIMGAVMYALLVVPLGHFNALAGSMALAMLMVPVISVTTYEMLNLVPFTLREAAYALGAYKWQMIKDIVLRSAKVGILTGIILGVARISGETAPLLFTSFNNQYLSFDIFKPMSSLTVTIFDYAMSPYKYWHDQAWAASFCLAFFILVCSLVAKFLLHYGNIFKGRKK
ncbi:MAG: phosphate ABC transporter permease PstA [Thermodesulfobacteria bacterium]|nr:phosphate ABC transporter permease PstA [Thermodesulfobacteriota bacterium]